MSMRRQVLTGILVTTVVLIVVLYVISRFIILSGFKNVETVMVKRDVRQVLGAIQAEMHSLNSRSERWLARSSTDEFLLNLNRRAVDESAPGKILADRQFDTVLIFDASAKPVFGLLNGYGVRDDRRILRELQSIFVKHPNLLPQRNDSPAVTGILLLSGSPLLFCSRPISTGAPESFSGTLVTGVRLDHERSRSLSESLHLNVTLWSPNDPQLSSVLGSLDLVHSDPVSVLSGGDDTIRGFGLLLDPFGQPSLIVEVNSTREFYHVGLATANYFVFCLVMVGIVFGAVSWQTMELSVLRRLTRLTDDVTSIAGQGSPRNRVGLNGSDELSLLAEEINSMLTALEGSEEALTESERRYRAVVEDQTDLICRFLPDGTLTFVNDAYCKVLGQDRDRMVGGNFLDLFDEESGPDVAKLLGGLDRDRPVSSHEGKLLDVEGEVRWYRWTERATFDSLGAVAEFQAVGHDVTARRHAEQAIVEAKEGLERMVEERTARLVEINEELRQEIKNREQAQERLQASAREKEVLLQEIHHRVKNNLQIMVSLLDLQSEYVHDDACLGVLRDAEHRIVSMALVHEHLYQSDNLAEIDIHEYIQSLVEDLFYAFEALESGPNLVLDVEPIAFGIGTALPLGLLVNELVTNSLKHAFEGQRKGQIRISLRRIDDDSFELKIADDGVGFPAGVDWRGGGSFGLFLVQSLVDQLHGEIDLDSTEGTDFTLRLRKIKERKKQSAHG